MPHDVEHLTTQVPDTLFEAYYRNSQGGSCYPTSNWTTKWAPVAGYYVYRGRDASHHTAVEADGWRTPTPYWGYVFQTGAFEPVGNPYWTDANYNRGNTCPVAARSAVPFGSLSYFQAYRPFFADLQEQAITAALAELGSATAELGVELKEARKTAKFVEDTLTNFIQLFRDFRVGRIPHLWKKYRRRLNHNPSWAADQVLGRWLEYRYAWSPMLMGIYDALNLLDKREAKHRARITIRKRVSADPVGTVTYLYNQTHGSTYKMYCDLKKTYWTQHAVYVVLTFTPRESFYTTLNDAGVLNPAAVVWETIPLSFVADWMVNLGDYFNAQAATRLFDLRGGSATHVHEWYDEVEATWLNQFCVHPSNGIPRAGGWSFNRVVLEPLDMSPKVILRQRLDWKRVLDLTAIAKTVFSPGGKNKLKRFRV